MLSGYGDIATAVKAVSRGAIHFLSKPAPEQETLDRVQEALAANARCLAYRQHRAAAAALFDRLSKREKAVMQLVVFGYRNKEIAAALEVSERTVESHRQKAMHKLQMRPGTELSHLMRMVEEREAGHCQLSMGSSCPRCRMTVCSTAPARAPTPI